MNNGKNEINVTSTEQCLHVPETKTNNSDNILLSLKDSLFFLQMAYFLKIIIIVC